MPEYIVVTRNKHGAKFGSKWRAANDNIFTTRHEAETERDMLREELPNWEYRVATIDGE